MPFRPPALDDRSFHDLVEEVLARIPAHTPEWTNPRQGDPGRTILELFAWLADTILYRANLIPERQRLVFLRLLGIPMRAAVPARGIIALSLDDEQMTGAVTLRPLAQVTGTAPVAFETLAALTVLPVTAEAYYKRTLSDQERGALGAHLLSALQDVYQVDRVEPYVTTPVFAGGHAEARGFELHQQAADRCLWLALLAHDPWQVAPVRKTLGEGPGGSQQVINVGIEPSIAVPDLFEDIGPRAKVPFLWEITGTREKDGREVVDYTRLEVIEDTTAGLTRRGVQRLLLPSERFIGAVTNDVRRDFRAGVGDLPPRLDDPDRDRRLVAWLRLRPEPGRPESLPVRMALSWVGVNAVEIDARQTAGPRIVGQSDGSPGQQMQLAAQSIDPASLIVQVETAGQGFQTWRRIDDLAFAGRDDPVYRLESDSSMIELGDGVRGHRPAAGMRVRVAQMRAGGGRAGNLPAGSLEDIRATSLDGTPAPKLKVAQPLPTAGGQDAETLAEAEQRIPAVLRHRNRAVTGDDYRRLAMDTPGISIGRVEVLPRFKPQQRRSGVPGVVSVMVLPDDGRLVAPNPRPDRPLLEAVHGYLGQRRPLGTELYVIGCEYVQVGVSIGVTIRDGFAYEEVLRDVRQAIRSHLWPLRPHGPHGEGWPLGQTVRDRELEVAVARVPGVSGLIEPGMNLFERFRSGEEEEDQWRKVARTHPNAPLEIRLQPWQLPELMSVVVVADQPPPDELGGTPNPFAEQAAVAVPVVPEVC